MINWLLHLGKPIVHDWYCPVQDCVEYKSGVLPHKCPEHKYTFMQIQTTKKDDRGQ